MLESVWIQIFPNKITNSLTPIIPSSNIWTILVKPNISFRVFGAHMFSNLLLVQVQVVTAHCNTSPGKFNDWFGLDFQETTKITALAAPILGS